MTDRDFKGEAADWLALEQSGEMTPEERRALDRWRDSGPDAELAYERAARVWHIAGGLEQDSSIAIARWENDRRYRFIGRMRTAGKALVAASAAAAAALLITSGGLLQTAREYAMGRQAQLPVLATGANHRASTKLADGTIVTLDLNTRLRVLEMGARRRIELISGHAFFRVAKDPQHPFLVMAMDKTVHAIGTAFDVDIRKDGVAVTLVEGKVRVDEPAGMLSKAVTADMTPGKQLIASDDRVWMMSSVNTAEATAWLEQRLVYLPDTLAKIVSDVNSGSKRKLVFQGQVDPNRKIVGVFQRGDTETLAAALEMKGVAHVVGRYPDRIEMVQDAMPNAR